MIEYSSQSSTAEPEGSGARLRLGVNIFLEKTYSLLQENKDPEIVAWSPEGDSILIKDAVSFQEKILPSAFGHSNFHSFVRQLNMYNFRKKKIDSVGCAYTHPCFQRGRNDLLENISRKKVKRKMRSIVVKENHVSVDEEDSREASRKQVQISESEQNQIAFLRFEQQKTQMMFEALRNEFGFLKQEYVQLHREHVDLIQRFNTQMTSEKDLLRKYNALQNPQKGPFFNYTQQDRQFDRNVPVATYNQRNNLEAAQPSLSEFITAENYPNGFNGMSDERMAGQDSQGAFADYEPQQQYF
jgi:hypothetical protein